MLLFAGAIMMWLGGCEKNGDVMPEWGCYVFVTTSPGEEMILLAKSGLSFPEVQVIFEDLKLQYGKDNVMWGFGSLRHKEPDGTYTYITAPETPPDCYEITMTLDFSDTSVPAKNDFFDYGFRGVKIIGNTAVCKWYDWACTEEDAENLIAWRESQYNGYYNNHTAGGGTIVGTTTMKKLGTEVHNMPIEF